MSRFQRFKAISNNICAILESQNQYDPLPENT
jgi:hypothetical protein